MYKRFRVKTQALSWTIGKIIVTYALVNFAWIFFRSNSFSQAIAIIESIFLDWNPWVFFDGTLFKIGLSDVELFVLVGAIAIMFLVDLIRYFKGMTLDMFLVEQNLWFRWAVVLLLICSVAVFGVYGPTFVPQQFIYFQF